MKSGKPYKDSQFQFVKNITHALYGEGRILSDKQTKQLFCETIVSFPTEKELQSAVSRAQVKFGNTHKNIITLSNYEGQMSSNVCSKSFKLKYLYEYCSNDLDKEIDIRRNQALDSYFNILELYSFLHSVLAGLYYFKAILDTYHPDLRPRTIFIFPDGYIKISEPTAGANTSAYHQLLFGQRSDYNISSELFAQLGQKVTTPHTDWEKENVWSLGLVLLESALLEPDMNVIYDNINYRIRIEELQEKLNQVEARYGSDFAYLISQMLNLSPQERLTFDQVQQALHELVQAMDQGQKQQLLATEVHAVQASALPTPQEVYEPVAEMEIVDPTPDEVIETEPPMVEQKPQPYSYIQQPESYNQPQQPQSYNQQSNGINPAHVAVPYFIAKQKTVPQVPSEEPVELMTPPPVMILPQVVNMQPEAVPVQQTNQDQWQFNPSEANDYPQPQSNYIGFQAAQEQPLHQNFQPMMTQESRPQYNVNPVTYKMARVRPVSQQMTHHSMGLPSTPQMRPYPKQQYLNPQSDLESVTFDAAASTDEQSEVFNTESEMTQQYQQMEKWHSLEARIQQQLALSKQTVLKYGGQAAVDVYLSKSHQ